MGIKPFHPRALKSMKSGGYEIGDAVCELIDNSIWHGGANKVEIKLFWDSMNKKGRLTELFIADNGSGMSKETLESSVMVGSSSTFDSVENFGRFGYGMIAGALTQCNLVEIYSKQSSSDWHYIKYNFEKVSQGEDIDFAIKKTPPEKYLSKIENSGTIVIWTEFDYADSFSNDWDVINSAGQKKGDLGWLYWELGRIYRKIIGKDIVTTDTSSSGNSPPVVKPNNDFREIYLNDRLLIPFDPLFMLKIPGFEDDPPNSHVYDEAVIPISIAESDKTRSNGKEEDNVIVRMTLLNEKWRQMNELKTNPRQKEVNERMMNRNEGISVLRNGREIFYGRIPGISSRQDTRDRYWGCEIDFPSTLDNRFGVRNVKIGIKLDKELRETLASVLKGPLGDARKEILKVMNQTRVETTKKANSGSHDAATERFKETSIGLNPKGALESPEEREHEITTLVEKFRQFDEKVDRNKFEEIGVVFQDDTSLSESMPFFEVRNNLGNNILIYNLHHPFFIHLQDVYSKLEELSKVEEIEGVLGREMTDEELSMRDEFVKQIQNTRYLVDLLLGSLAAAKGDIDPDRAQNAGSTLNSLISRWTENLYTVSKDKDFQKRISND